MANGGERGKMGLMLWCRGIAKEHGVNVVDFGESWLSGGAFCSLLYHFLQWSRPDLIDISRLPTMNPHETLNLAFSIAEKIGIPRLLGIDDMKDKRLIFTYIVQLYHAFKPSREGWLWVMQPGSQRWSREWARLIVSRNVLCLGQKIMTAAETPTLALIQPMSHTLISLVRLGDLHKEVLTNDLRRSNSSIICLQVGDGKCLLCGDSQLETQAWYSALTSKPPNDPSDPNSGKAPLVPPPFPNPLLSGFLWKRGDKGPTKNWKKRFFVLKNYSLSYWASQTLGEKELNRPEDVNTTGGSDNVYCLKLACTVYPAPNIHHHAFGIEFPGRIIILKAENKEICDEWMAAIKASCNHYNATAMPITPTKEKEGPIKVESHVARGLFWAHCCQGVVTLYDNTFRDKTVVKIPLYECAIEEVSHEGQTSLRLVIGMSDQSSTNSGAPVFYVSGTTNAETTEWRDALIKQKYLVDAYVSTVCFEPAVPVIDRTTGGSPNCTTTTASTTTTSSHRSSH